MRPGPLQSGGDRLRQRAGGGKKLPPLDVVYREARDIVWQRRGRLFIGLLLMGLGRLCGLVLPASSKFLVDRVIGQGDTHLLGPLAAAVGLASVIQAATSYTTTHLLGVAAQQAIADLRREMQAHVLALPVRYFDRVKSGEVISRVMNDAEGVRNLVGNGLVQLVGGLLTAGVAVGVLFWLNWRMTTAILLVLALFGSLMAVAFARLRPLFRKRNEIQAEITGRLAEAIGGIRIVKAYVAEKREKQIFSDGIERIFQNIRLSITSIAGVSAATILLFGAGGAILIWIGGSAIVAGRMTLGDFVMYIFFTGMVAAPLIQIASISTQLSEAFAGLDRIREVRSRLTEADDQGRVVALSSVRGEVRFDAVEFAYEPEVPVLRGIDFVAAAGTTTALVGSSGSGKSTLASLVLAFDRPQVGRVLVDGIDLSTVRLDDYRRRVAVVLQDNFLFDGTVADNILYSRPDAGRDAMIEMATLAHCDEFVEGFPDGWDTVIGERGVRLSGGQRQRIAIARALLADPAILVLDEATSSLDSESEAAIQDGLKRLRSGRTTFVIAHRLSTIRAADQILVIEQGRIVERGRHAELLALGGRYCDLHDRQFRLETDRFVNPGEDFTPETESASTVTKAKDAKDL